MDTPLAPARQGRLGTQGELPRRGKRRCPGVRVPRQRNKSQVHALTFIGNFTWPAAAGKRKARQRRAFLRASRAISVQSCRRQGGRTGAPQCAALNSPRKSGRVPDFLTSARAAAARPRPLCGREGVIACGFSGTTSVSKGDSVPLGNKQEKIAAEAAIFFLAFYLVARRRALASMRSRVTSSSTAPMITRPRTRF